MAASPLGISKNSQPYMVPFLFWSSIVKNKQLECVGAHWPSGPCYWALVPYLEARSAPMKGTELSRATCILPDSITIVCDSFAVPTDEMRIEKEAWQ
ncbi:hypothetical protein VNO78_21092 [Psophocarpus tetragonolobus]|uniref:Uncharacterized protein n=1 Tax=Psophocarpus tetragonolobus TaxID=3891 RepID=A0AAN9XI28_PSOTE